MMRVGAAPKCRTESVSFPRGRSTARFASEKFSNFRHPWSTPMCPRQERLAAPVGRALGFQPVGRARSRVLTGSRLAELELVFSPAQEAAMFGRSALALAAPAQGSIFPRSLLVSPTLKVAGSVCL